MAPSLKEVHMPVDVPTARQAFAQALAGFLPPTTQITIRNEAALGDAAAIHCRWPLTDKGPHSGDLSREITVQITAAAVNAFRAADGQTRGAMLEKFSNVCKVRMAEGGYNEQDPSPPAFIISIDDYSLEA
jgi:hypothetical protein